MNLGKTWWVICLKNGNKIRKKKDNVGKKLNILKFFLFLVLTW